LRDVKQLTAVVVDILLRQVAIDIYLSAVERCDREKRSFMTRISYARVSSGQGFDGQVERRKGSRVTMV
jgi:hypothetical protein